MDVGAGADICAFGCVVVEKPVLKGLHPLSDQVVMNGPSGSQTASKDRTSTYEALKVSITFSTQNSPNH